jgi:hypothetical protein
VKRRSKARRKSTAALRSELEGLVAQAQALIAASSEQLHAAQALRAELQAEHEANQHSVLLMLNVENERVH